METRQKTLLQLTIPIGFELLFQMLTGMVDTMMLSALSDRAVGAVGTANTYIYLFMMMFSIISTGMVAVMTQYIGAGKPGVAWQARQVSAAFNTGLGIALSLLLYLRGGWILQTVGVADALQEWAALYLRIVGGGCLLNALIPIYSGYLRAFGHTRESLFASTAANLMNLGLNALFLFVLHRGVAGVAAATVLSRLLNLALVMWLSRRLVKAQKDPARIPLPNLLRQILQIGLPSAMESLLYNLSMTLIIRFLNQMDPEGLNVTARSYALQITNFSYCTVAALAQANAILIGWHMGAGDYEACRRSTRRAALWGVVLAVGCAGVLALAGPRVVGLLSSDERMVSLVCKLLVIDIVLEIGRGVNLVYGQALKTSGDSLYPVVIAVVFMYLCAVAGTYFFAIRLELWAVGCYLALALDEDVRAVFMLRRWLSGKWQSKGLVASSQRRV